MLEYDSDIRICIEPKPNEPIDRSICGTMGHVLAVSAATIDPGRVGGNLESAMPSWPALTLPMKSGLQWQWVN